MFKTKHFSRLLDKVMALQMPDPVAVISGTIEQIIRVVEFIMFDLPNMIVYDRNGRMRPIFAKALDERRKRRHDPGWLE